MKKIVLTLIFLFFASTSFATTYEEFDSDLQRFGMFYKVCLNGVGDENDSVALEIAFGKALNEWRQIEQRFAQSPPNQFAGFYDFDRHLGNMGSMLGGALLDIIGNNRVAAKQKLEFVRVALWELRARSGILALADKLTDIDLVQKELNDVVLASGVVSSSRALSLVAVLAIKWEEAATLPSGDVDLPDYHQAIGAGRESIVLLAKALTDGDRPATMLTLGRFREAFTKLFMLPTVM